MLKIIDSSGETIGILEDEDSAPKMVKDKKSKKGNSDGTVGTVAKSGADSSETETGTEPRSSEL